MKNIIQLLIDQIKQPSTWAGIGIVANAVGITLSPDAWTEIGLAIIAVIGAVEVVRNERASK